jgi:signal transduction histidine kinase
MSELALARSEIMPRWQRLTQQYVKLALFAVAYFVAYGCGTVFLQTASAPLWFPDSVMLCALLWTPRKQWWLYIAVAVPIRFAFPLYPSVPLWFIFATSANDMLKALFAAHVLGRRLEHSSVAPANLSQLAKFVGIAVLLVPGLSATAGAVTRHILGYQFWASWYQWFLGDALANTVLTPALLYWGSRDFRNVRPHFVELALWTLGFAPSLIFTLRLAHSDYAPIAFCLPVPFLIWAAARFGPIGASTTLSLTALVITARVARTTLFSMTFESHGLLFLQAFLFVISVPVLALAVLIEERNRVEKYLRENQEKLGQQYEEVRYLAGKLITAQDDERKNIALELHDDVAQRLALLALQIERIDNILPAELTNVHHAMFRLKEETEEAATALRELSHELHSSALHYLGLPAALKNLSQNLARQHGLSITLETGDLKDSSQNIDLGLFRVAQEALSNAIKHGKAEAVRVRLAQHGDQICLDIQDNGAGFNPSNGSSGLGLVSMRERVRLLNGAIFIESSTKNGSTSIHVRVPIASTQGKSAVSGE